MGCISLETLGSLNMGGRDGAEYALVLAQPKRLGLFIYLTLAGRGGPLRRSTLVAAFWPEADEVRARSSLSQSLFFLRRHLPDGVIGSRGREEVWVSPGSVETDVARFEAACADGRWAEAVACYAGPFLNGLHVAGAEGFDAWASAERQRLEGLAASAAWSLCSKHIHEGRLAEAEQSAAWAMDLNWTDETPVRRFIADLDRAGDRAAALRFFDELRHRLQETFEVGPSERTLAVVERIRNGSEGGLATADGTSGALPRRDAAFPESPDERAAAPPSPEASAPGVSDRSTNRRRWLRTASVVALASILGVVGGYALLSNPDPGLVPNLVVVPPLTNDTGDPAVDEVAALAAAWIEEAVRQVEGAQTVPSTFAEEYEEEAIAGGSATPLTVVARRTRAGWAVGGTVRVKGDSLEFHVEIASLVPGRTGEDVVEAGPRDSVNIVIDRLARRVSGALAFRLSPYMASIESGALPSAPTIEAFREYHLGYEAFDRQDWGASFAHHLAAYELDTTLVRALVAAAYVAGDARVKDSLAAYADQRRHLLSVKGRLDLDILLALQANDMERALAAVRKSARMGEGASYSSISEAWFAIQVNRPGEALAATERYDPSLPWRRGEAHAYWRYRAWALHLLGEHERELAEARRGRQPYPGRLDLLAWEVRALAALGRPNEVEVLLRQARALSNDNHLAAIAAGEELRAHGYIVPSKEVFAQAAAWLTSKGPPRTMEYQERVGLYRALYGAERWAQAREVALGLLAERPDDVLALGRAGLTAARTGDTRGALEIVVRLSRMPPALRGENAYLMGSIHAVLGQPDVAMPLLYRAVGEGFRDYLRLHSDMNFESLSGRADFEALVKPKG